MRNPGSYHIFRLQAINKSHVRIKHIFEAIRTIIPLLALLRLQIFIAKETIWVFR